jgi:hypothetical protein
MDVKLSERLRAAVMRSIESDLRDVIEVKDGAAALKFDAIYFVTKPSQFAKLAVEIQCFYRGERVSTLPLKHLDIGETIVVNGIEGRTPLSLVCEL